MKKRSLKTTDLILTILWSLLTLIFILATTTNIANNYNDKILGSLAGVAIFGFLTYRAATRKK